ncbi:hypothetical protein MC885_016484 [Smutsia gigantea]|nr:hypothetical protein MC885_016484 [Smutsia gigantea]
MHKHYTVHFTKGALPLRTPTEHYLLDPELGRQKGCCHQWCHDPAAPQAHGPCRLPPPVHWRRAYHSDQGGASSWRRGPQPPALQQQPQPPPPSCLWQRLCFIHGAQEGSPATAAAPMQLASAPQLPPEPTTSRTMASTMASGGPALPSGAGTLREPSRPIGTQPLTTPEFLGPFTSYSSGAHPAILGALCLPPCLQSGPLAPQPASSPLTLVPVLEGTPPCRWASGQPPLLHLIGSKASRAVCPWGFCLADSLAVTLARLSLFPALPPLARQGMEDLGQQVISSSLLASSGVGETDILTEDDVYCSCLAKTLCHVPVPVTVGFYAHFGCRLHMMLDKITSENLLALGEEGGGRRERSLCCLPRSSLPQDPLALRPACPSPDAHKSVLTRYLPTPTASVPHPCSFPH